MDDEESQLAKLIEAARALKPEHRSALRRALHTPRRPADLEEMRRAHREATDALREEWRVACSAPLTAEEACAMRLKVLELLDSRPPGGMPDLVFQVDLGVAVGLWSDRPEGTELLIRRAGVFD